MKSFISSVSTKISKTLTGFIYSPPIETLGLNKRALNALKKANIHTIKELKAAKEDLQTLPGMGVKTLTNVLEALDNFEYKIP